MAFGWTLQVANEGAAWATYPTPIDGHWINRLNGLGYANLVIPGLDGLAAPVKGQVMRIVWDLGGSTERLQFSGVIMDCRQLEGSTMRVLRCFDLFGKLWKASTGGFRDYRARTPFSIIQGGGTPTDLLTNAQGNNVIAYGTVGITDVVDGANPGTSMDFRADSGKLFVNIQRLCLQARYDGASYGLEMFAQFENPNASTPKFYLRKRTHQIVAYSAEVYTLPSATGAGTVLSGRRGVEGLTADEAIRVIGSGDGTGRVQSSIIGAGGLEGIVTDKTIENTTNATNMANRLTELLNPATEVITLQTAKHDMQTIVGDDVTVAQAGVANTTLRCFEKYYSLSSRCYYLTLGRPRPIGEQAFLDLETLTSGESTSYQHTLGKKVNNAQPVGAGNGGASNGALANNATLINLLNFTANDFRHYRDEGLFFWLEIEADAVGTQRTIDDNGGTPRTIIDALGTWDVELYLSADGILFNIVYAERVELDGLFFYWARPMTLPKELFQEPAGLNTVIAAELDVTNRTGSARNVATRVRGWIMT